MRQVCTEASNESFAGNFGFYEEKKDEGEDKKRGGRAESRKMRMAFHMRRKRKSERISCHTLERIIQRSAPM